MLVMEAKIVGIAGTGQVHYKTIKEHLGINKHIF